MKLRNLEMPKDDFIRYFVGIAEHELKIKFPNHADDEYALPDLEKIDLALEILINKFNHIKSGITSDYLINERTEK